MKMHHVGNNILVTLNHVINTGNNQTNHPSDLSYLRLTYAKGIQ